MSADEAGKASATVWKGGCNVYAVVLWILYKKGQPFLALGRAINLNLGGDEGVSSCFSSF